MSFLDNKEEKERDGCSTLFVFLLLCDYKSSVSLTHGSLGWSVVCDCGISSASCHTHLLVEI